MLSLLSHYSEGARGRGGKAPLYFTLFHKDLTEKLSGGNESNCLGELISSTELLSNKIVKIETCSLGWVKFQWDRRKLLSLGI